MRSSTKIILLSALLLAGCSNNVNRAFYEGIKTQTEGYKTPNERAVTPTPSYDTYIKERDSLKQNDPASEKNESTDFSLK